MAIQNSSTIDCEVRFLCQTLKMATHTVTETLEEFRRMGLVKFIPSKGRVGSASLENERLRIGVISLRSRGRQ